LPSRRASDRPMAMACLRLLTVRPLPLLSVPFLNSRISFSTFLCEDGEYFRVDFADFFAAVDFLAGVLVRDVFFADAGLRAEEDFFAEADLLAVEDFFADAVFFTVADFFAVVDFLPEEDFFLLLDFVAMQISSGSQMATNFRAVVSRCRHVIPGSNYQLCKVPSSSRQTGK
jgi:hypothetical protein